MLAVLAIGSFVLASLTAGAVVPAGVRPQNADSRLLKFGPADNQIEWVPTEAIALLRESHSVDLSKGADALRTIHPELAGVSDTIIYRLGNHTLRGPGFLDITGMEFVRRESHDLEARATYPTPTPSKYPILTTLFNSVSASGLSSTVSTLSSYTTRYYKSTNAAVGSTWIQAQFANAAGPANVKIIANSFNQPNVIATIPAKSGSTLTDVIILGVCRLNLRICNSNFC
ncbi:hypothetical protein FS749_004698 [Ceratobasidium sp. UAMH 11750]|nr:hypothetical protein FS749_004698 [Ceratobasidium sp. UAMH 11750]